MSHLIDHDTAMHFIEHYQRLLHEVMDHPSFPRESLDTENSFNALMQARDWLAQHPQTLQDALDALQQAQAPLPPDVEQAVRSLRVQRWVYLRDTAHYSIFLPVTTDEDPQAYAVKSLTTRLRDMTGCSGMVLSTGLMDYAGGITTDGLIAPVVYLGPNYRQSYAEYLAQARALGQFYQKQLPDKPLAQPVAKPSARRKPTASKPVRTAAKTRRTNT